MALAGFAPWKPGRESVALYEDAMRVFKEYEDYLPMTGRQVFYRLVATYGYEKSDRLANQLYNVLGRARRAGWLPFTHLRDGGGQNVVPLTYADEGGFWDSVEDNFEHYNRNRQAGQEVFVELFCEAPGMIPQLQRVSFDYSVPVYGTRGYTGLSVIGEVARRALMRDVPTTILQVGDLDPSGVGIFDTLAADVRTFVHQGVQACKLPDAHRLAAGLGLPQKRIDELAETDTPPGLEAERIALTWEQVREHDLPTAPPSAKDSRTKSWGYDETAQAEALPPDLLAQIVRDAIEEQLDLDVYRAEVGRERADREAIREKLDGVSPS